MGSKNQERRQKIIECAQKHFGEKVVKTSTPGGEGRASWRLHLESGSVIATLRPNFRRTHLEALALSVISERCTDTPACLGVVGDILFQTDVGGKRLNQEIMKLNGRSREDVAHEAIASIFRIQSAAREARLNTIMPHLGTNADWIRNLVHAVTALEPFSAGRSKGMNTDALASYIARPAVQFVKWDCRSGNAAIGDDGRVRWFDFEYCGLRHGAEDLAWLLGDEAWPLSPEVMEEIVIAAFDPNSAHELRPYMDYLAVYLTLHCIQRFKLIVKEVRKRGWQSKTRVRKYDDAGIHPEFAIQICKVGAFFADRHSLTTVIGRDFEDAQKVFEEVLRSGNGKTEQIEVPA